MSETNRRYAPQNLTVILRNDAPLFFCGDSPSYRSVRIKLTAQQREAIELRYVGKSGGHDQYEDISKCFLED